MNTLILILVCILSLLVGFVFGIVYYIHTNYAGDIMVRNDDECLTEIHFNPGTDLSITNYKYIVLQMKHYERENSTSYNGQ